MEKWKDVNFFMLQIWTIQPPGQKKRKEGFSVFLCMCGSFCAGRVDVNSNMHVCCVCHSLMCPIYTHTLYFVVNSLKQLVLNILKATTEWKHRLAYVLGRKHYSFYTLSWFFTCLAAQSCHHFSVSSLPELVSISNQNKGWRIGIDTTNFVIAFLLCYKFYFSY